jgi:hypothetical protein
MQFNQAIDLLKRPKYAEGTKLASSRDDRNNAFLWKKGELNSGQIYSLAQAIEKATREIAKQRRKPLGGGTGQVVAIQVFQITAIYSDDLFSAQTWDGTTLGGTDIFIAKQSNFRPSLTTEIVDGVTISHTYSDDNHRTSNDGANSQNEVCWPRFAVGNEIVAALSTNGTPVSDTSSPPQPVEWIDLTNRVWMTY